MSPRKTRRGTVRESISEMSIDKSSKSISRPVRSSRRINKSQIVKGSEEDSDSPVDVNNLTDNVTATSLLNDTSSNTRKRTRKAKESAISQDTSVSVTEELKTKLRSKKSISNVSKPKEQTKNDKSLTIDNNALISEDESFNTKNQKSNKQVHYSFDNLISEDENIEESPGKKRKINKQNIASRKKEFKTPEKAQKASLSDIKYSKDVTPESSPLNVSLTPNRSTKTPKKSPINIGSPKTHSHDSLKLLNVPRKLSISDSPPSSEKSSNSLLQPDVSNVDELVGDLIASHKSSKSGSSKKKQKKSISPTFKPRFSKSPKIVFKTPKSKSKKSPVKRVSTSKKSPTSSSNLKNISRTDLIQKKSKKTSDDITPAKVIKPPAATSSQCKGSNDASLLAKSQQSLKTDSPETIKSFKIASPTKAKRSTKSIEPLETLTLVNAAKSANSSTVSPTKAVKSPKSDKLSKAISPSKSKRSPKSKSEISLNNTKTSPSKRVSLSSKSKKSPKIILPLSSKKMPKIVLTLKSKKSPIKSSKSISPSKSKSSSKSKKSPKIASPSKILKVKLSPKKAINNKDLSQNSSMSPRVIVNKLSSPELKSSNLSVKKSQPSVKLVRLSSKLETQKNVSSKSRSSKSPQKLTEKQSLIKSSTPAKIVKSQLSTSKISCTVNLSFKNNTPSDLLERKLSHLKPTNTSTPREKFKRTLNLTSNKAMSTSNHLNSFVMLNGSPNPKSKASKKLNSHSKIKIDHQLLEDVSEPFINDSSLMHMSDMLDSDNSQQNSTFDINKSDSTKRKSSRKSDPNILQKGDRSNTFEINKNASNTSSKGKSKKDDTYEVENPKTPGLQRITNKRTLDEAELNEVEGRESKKSCRVHFANSDSETKGQSSGITRIGTPGHAIQQNKILTTINKTPSNQSFLNKSEVKCLNLSSTSQMKTPINKKSLNLLSNSTKSRKSNHQTQVASVNRLSRPKSIIGSDKKLAVKTPTAKKIPNFAEIHKKNFSKMESIIDLKRRVENRHVNLNTATLSTKKTYSQKHQGANNKLAPADSTNGTHNRFGFKLRKNDAVDIISKKQTSNIESREKKKRKCKKCSERCTNEQAI